MSLVAAASSAALSQPAPGSVEAAQAADVHFKKGKALLKDGKKQAAYDEYVAAFKLKQSYDVAGNLGSLELDLGKPRDAAEHLTFAITHYAASGTTPEQLEKAKARLAEAKKLVAVVTIDVNVAGAEVLIDDKSVGRSPFGEALFVEPGKHSLTAKLAGYQDAQRELQANKGELYPVAFTLAPASGPGPVATSTPTASASAVPSAPPTTSASVTPPPTGKSVPVLVVGFGLGAAALGAGIGITVAASGKASSAQEKLAAIQGTGQRCPPQGCEAVRDDLKAHDTLANVGVVAFIGAGVLTAATLTYLLWPTGDASKTSSLRVSPFVAPGASGFMTSGKF